MSQHPQILLRELAAGHKDFLLGTNGAGPSLLDSHSEALFADSLLSVIPRTTPIASELEATGLKPAIARKISDSYLESADHLRQVCQTSLRSAYTKAFAKGHLSQGEAQVMIKAWTTAYAQQTRCWVETALNRARDAVAKAQTTSVATSTNEKRPVFNYEYTPLLEKYFQYNAYPSAPDRAVLARKSMMTPRQIEVWFQNHRNRAKKEGKVLRKLREEPLPPELSLRSLEEKMPYFAIPLDERKSLRKSSPARDDLSDAEQCQPTVTPLPVSPFGPDTVESDSLNPPRSSQAFPLIYVHRDVDCLLTEPRAYRFPPPTWYRKPSVPYRSQLRIDMDDFTVEFNQKLHLRAPESKVSRSQSQSWCTGRYIPWCPAPHPALIRSTRASSLYPPAKQLPSIPATVSCPHAFRSPSPSTSSAPFTPAQPLSAISSRRKVAGLPKRTPKHKSTAHARESPILSEVPPESAHPSSPSSSRNSSFSSSISSRHPSSSSSNASSSFPTTPMLPSSLLPEDGSSSAVPVSGLDFHYNDDLADNTSKITPSVEKSFPFSVTTQPKQRFGKPAEHLSRNHIHWMHDSPS